MKGIIFDFNGTLFFDSHMHYEAWRIFSKKLRGYEFTDQEMREKMFGRTNADIIEYAIGKKPSTEMVEKLAKECDIIDIGKDLVNFGQTAAALMNLDLVICNDTSLAHLAGALGIPCFVLLPYDVNWRWHDDLTKCDWYDSLKLFRQKSFGEWNGIFDDIKEILENYLKK